MAIFVLVVSIVMTVMFKVQSGVKGCQNVLAESQILRTPEVFAAQWVTWLDLENKSFAKKKYEKSKSSLLLVIFQSRSSSLM